tara:strand:+ start:225 stop:557 length:333 start_codon:yes stop_codon:yes gene_type:complete
MTTQQVYEELQGDIQQLAGVCQESIGLLQQWVSENRSAIEHQGHMITSVITALYHKGLLTTDDVHNASLGLHAADSIETFLCAFAMLMEEDDPELETAEGYDPDIKVFGD